MTTDISLPTCPVGLQAWGSSSACRKNCTTGRSGPFEARRQSQRQQNSQSVSGCSRALRVACDPGSVVHSDAAPHRDYSLDTRAARHDSLFKDEVERRIRKAANLMVAADKLAPYDRKTFNPALVLWKAIADIPPAARKSLLRYLLPRDIERVWRLSGEKYWAKRQDLLAAVGPNWSIWDDLPSEPDQVVRFRGRAAVPLPGLLGSFSKVFFAQPKTYELYGRVQMHGGPLGDLLYPLYFKINVAPSTIQATGEVSEMQLEYLQPEQLQLQPGDVPKKGRWPHIRAPIWPFNAHLVDHMRAVGPGVYVGVGWKAPREDRVELGRRFLPFMLVREYDDKDTQL